jgi:iron complex outermembrane recepter protein
MRVQIGRAQLAAALMSSCAFFPGQALAQSSVGDDHTSVAAGLPQSQDVPPSGNTPDAGQDGRNEIVVRGISRSLAAAIQTKRDADSIVDAIGAEDVGKFPDVNVAESLQRVTGVQITRARGEGQEATIRGMPTTFTQVQFNGRTLTSAAGDTAAVSRSFNFTILPSEFIRTLEVHKTPTADLEEGGLAGTVIVRTPRALAIGHSTFSISAQGNWEDNTKDVGPRLSALYTNVFAEGKLGVALGASYIKRTRETHTVDFLGFRDDLESLAGGLDLNGDGKIVPTQRVEYGNSLFLQIDREKTERVSGLGSIEFKPSDDAQFYVEGLYSHLIDNYDGLISLVRYTDNKGPTTPAGIVIGSGRGNDRAVAWLSKGVEIRPEGRNSDRTSELLSGAAGFKFTPGAWTISGEASYSRSNKVMSNLGIEDSGRFELGYDSRVDDQLIQPIYGPGSYEASMDPNNYQVLTLNGQFNKRLKDELYDFRFDVNRDFETNWLRSIKIGFKHSNRTLYSDNGRLVMTAAQINTLLGGTLPQSIYGKGTFSAASLIKPATPLRGEFLGSYHGPVTLPEIWLISDTSSFLDQFSNAQLLAAGSYSNDLSGVLDVAEKTYAGYAMARFGSGTAPLSGNIGVRVVRTEQSVRGISPDFNAITFQPAAGNLTTIPAAALIQVDRGYTDWLPSANLRWNIASNLTLRLGASRTMARPNLDDISPTATGTAARRTIAQGNPYLDPFRSNNLDASFEWYFGKRGLLSVALFYKNLTSLIRSSSERQYLTVTQINADGSSQPVELDFTVGKPVNGQGVKVKGIELSYQQPFTFLPGPLANLGFIGNFTYLQNNDQNRLNGTSRNSYNLSGYYEDGRIGVRLAYTFRDTYLSGPAGGYGDGILTIGYGTVNGNVTYRFTPNVSMVIDVDNLFDADQRTVSRLTGAPLQYQDAGRRFLIGFRGRF